MEILVDPADQSAHCMNISVGKLNWFWQCPLGLTRFYLHRCFLIDFSTRFGLTRPRQNDYIEKEVFEKRLSQKRELQKHWRASYLFITWWNRREHRCTSVNSLRTRFVDGLVWTVAKTNVQTLRHWVQFLFAFVNAQPPGGVLKKGSIRGDSSRGLTPSPFTLHFWQKRYLALSYTFLIDKWYPFHWYN